MRKRSRRKLPDSSSLFGAAAAALVVNDEEKTTPKDEEYTLTSSSQVFAAVHHQNQRIEKKRIRNHHHDDDKNNNKNNSNSSDQWSPWSSMKMMDAAEKRSKKKIDAPTEQTVVDSRDLVIDGSGASVGSYPWYASLHAASTISGLLLEGFYCGGQLVSPNFVLSGESNHDNVLPACCSNTMIGTGCLLFRTSRLTCCLLSVCLLLW
jgi:hypothetical protein